MFSFNNHLTKLSIVQFIISTCIELFESNLNLRKHLILLDQLSQTYLLVCQIFANILKLFFGHKTISILVHILEYLLNMRFLAHKFFKSESFIKISVQVVEKLMNLLPKIMKEQYPRDNIIVLTLMLELRTGSGLDATPPLSAYRPHSCPPC